MIYFNTTALKQNIQTGIPLAAYNHSDYDSRLDSIRVTGRNHSTVASLGGVSQDKVDLFRQLSTKYPGYIGWRVASVDDQGTTISKTIPHIIYYTVLRPQVEAGIFQTLGPWCLRYARDEDIIATAFAMGCYGVNESTSNNILGSSAAFLSGIGSYLLNNRSNINF